MLKLEEKMSGSVLPSSAANDPSTFAWPATSTRSQGGGQHRALPARLCTALQSPAPHVAGSHPTFHFLIPITRQGDEEFKMHQLWMNTSQGTSKSVFNRGGSFKWLDHLHKCVKKFNEISSSQWHLCSLSLLFWRQALDSWYPYLSAEESWQHAHNILKV